MERDLRQTPLYKEIEEYFRRVHEPGFGKITGAKDPEPSPDGRTVAFVGTRLDKLEGKEQGRICLAATDGSGFRQVTNGPNDDGTPRWAPNGERLIFASDRVQEGRNQLYVLEAGALGEARALPEVPGTIEYAAWSPDGSQILLGVAGLGADEAGASGSGTIKDAADVPSWVPEVESPENVDREWRRVWLLDVSTNELRPLSREGINIWEAAWCGNDAVVALASERPGEEAWYAAELELIDARTGEERPLLKSDVQLGWACGNTSGSLIAVVEALCSDRLIVAGDLLLVDPATGDARRVDTLGSDVTWLSWRNETSLFAMGLRGLRAIGFEVDAAAAKAVEVWSSDEASGDWYPVGAPVGNGRAFATVLQSPARPPEVVVIEDGAVRAIASTANEGTSYASTLLPVRERFAWTAPDGLEMEGLLSLPEGEDPHALIVHVHGGPVWAYQNGFPKELIPLLVSRGYAVFQPNPRGSGGRGRKFAEMVVGDMGGADSLDILTGIDALVAGGVADPGRIGVTGGSYGGFMSCWLPTRDRRFKAAVAISPVTDWYSQHFNSNIGFWDSDFLRDRPEELGGEYHARSPVLAAAEVVTPTLLTAGLRDRCTPPGQAIEFYRGLRWNGVDTELVLYPEEGHGVRNFPTFIDQTTRLVAWFERFMPARAAGDA